jgi:phosphate transport system protein
MNLFVRDMELLTGSILERAAIVEEGTHAAIRSLCDRKPDVAQQVVRGDAVIDRMEVRIEQDCLRMLVLHDPVAGDLRRVTTALKINNELERVADLAVSIGQRALALADDPRVIPIPEDLESMAGVVLAMVRDSIDAYVDAHADLARAAITMDDEVDRQHRRMIDELKAMMRARPDRLDTALHLFSAAAHLERIADHATNIAEEVIYLKEGAIIRHRKGEVGEARGPARAGREPFPSGRRDRNSRPEDLHHEEIAR